ncbi:MAG: hypothetical protein JWR80_541 [Bradyrhizobium sp.]|nr:hypothetical protein [Bradyrhizobium sp.]
MQTLSEKIITLAQQRPEGEPLFAKQLLNLGSRAGIDQALARLTRRGTLLRVGRGVYVRPVEGKFGTRPPATDLLVQAVAGVRGETVVSHGAAAANALGLTTQVPARSVYLTSGPSRTLTVGKQQVELRHAPGWQLTLAEEPAGEIVRALAWLGPEASASALPRLKRKVPKGTLRRIVNASALLPDWLARQIAAIA